MPRVSVIIPTYNYKRFIGNAIESVIQQSYRDYEIIVIDDGSTDGTSDYIEKYKNEIRYFYKDNEGPASARNLGIKVSKGEFICFLDADDSFTPQKLEIQIKALEEGYGEIGLVYSDYLCTNEYNNKILKYYKCRGFNSHKEALNYLIRSNYINTSTVMIPAKCFEEIGFFREDMKYLEDLDLWIRIGRKYKFLYIDKPLVRTRSHKNNLRNRISRVDKIKCYNYIRNSFNKE